ncbi:MAG: PadR family transcriptional regulator [Planctomycetota bacterium]
MDPLTDLEAAALGCVHRNQPCTAHFVRTRFRASPSARFSDSAGSVYPTMKRLEQRGLVSASDRTEGRRRVRYYRCSAKGRRLLRGWIGPPLGAGAAVTVDPLRTRMLSLELLEPGERAAWFRAAEAVLREQLARIEQAASPTDDDLFFVLANENARAETRARLRWLRLAERRLREAGLLDQRAAR